MLAKKNAATYVLAIRRNSPNPVNELGKLSLRHGVRPSFALTRCQAPVRTALCDIELVRWVPELDRNITSWRA